MARFKGKKVLISSQGAKRLKWRQPDVSTSILRVVSSTLLFTNTWFRVQLDKNVYIIALKITPFATLLLIKVLVF
jgi:hypothetical protein